MNAEAVGTATVTNGAVNGAKTSPATETDTGMLAQTRAVNGGPNIVRTAARSGANAVRMDAMKPVKTIVTRAIAVLTALRAATTRPAPSARKAPAPAIAILKPLWRWMKNYCAW